MSSSIRSIGIALSLGLVALLAGCASSQSEKTAGAANIGVVCDKCKTTYAQSSVLQGGDPHNQQVRVVGGRTVATHECTECKQVATEYIQAHKNRVADKFVHKCDRCGGEMKTCHVPS